MNAIAWFAIPVVDLERARAFYCRIMGYENMADLVTPNGTCAIFPYDEKNGVGGSLNPFMGIKPSTDSGTSIWLAAGDDLQQVLDRVGGAGGKVAQEKTPIGENAAFGYIASIIDCEGNRIGLHSMG